MEWNGARVINPILNVILMGDLKSLKPSAKIIRFNLVLYAGLV